MPRHPDHPPSVGPGDRQAAARPHPVAGRVGPGAAATRPRGVLRPSSCGPAHAACRSPSTSPARVALRPERRRAEGTTARAASRRATSTRPSWPTLQRAGRRGDDRPDERGDDDAALPGDRHGARKLRPGRLRGFALSGLDRFGAVFDRFRSGFRGKQTPVDLWWGTFDLSVARFSGRAASPPFDRDAIERGAWTPSSRSVGFWPGDEVTRAGVLRLHPPQAGRHRVGHRGARGRALEPRSR